MPYFAQLPFNLFSSLKVHVYWKLLRAVAVASKSMSKHTLTVLIKDAMQTCWENKLIPQGDGVVNV